MTQIDLRQIAGGLFKKAIAAADPARALRDALKGYPLALPTSGRLIIIAFGKAACLMLSEALCHLPKGPKGVAVKAVAVTNYENWHQIDGAEVFAAGHPLPDKNGLEAGLYVESILSQAHSGDSVLFLISGGGSALLPAPVSGLTLDEKIAVNDLLLKHGFDIGETNLVRQHLSRFKGGGLARIAAPALLRALIVSDVIGDDIRAIASGPTATPIAPRAQAIELLRARGLWDHLPVNARTILQKPVAPLPARPQPAAETPLENSVICSNRHSLNAICAPIDGFASPYIVSDALVGNVQDAACEIVKAIKSIPANQPAALLWGGETTVNLNGNGRGGRNQELSLHVANRLKAMAGDWVFLSGGTDGRDGPTDAAGGMVDAMSLQRIEKAGLDFASLMENNDSYRALEAAGDLLKIGATGTNVADIQIFLKA